MRQSSIHILTKQPVCTTEDKRGCSMFCKFLFIGADSSARCDLFGFLGYKKDGKVSRSSICRRLDDNA